MGKVVDITDKLSFDGNPTLVVKGKKLEVNADAPTVLKVMNFMQKENVNDMEVVSAMYQLIFPEKSRTEIDKLKPSISDWMIIIQEAMALVTGEANSQGEHCPVLCPIRTLAPDRVQLFITVRAANPHKRV